MKNNKKICMLLLSLLLIIVIFTTIILLIQTFLNIKEIEKNMVLEISGEEEKKELREFKLSEEKIREYKEKAIGGGSIDPDDERVYYRLSYDRETKKKYIEVIVPVIDAYGDTVSLRNEEYEL